LRSIGRPTACRANSKFFDPSQRPKRAITKVQIGKVAPSALTTSQRLAFPHAMAASLSIESGEGSATSTVVSAASAGAQIFSPTVSAFRLCHSAAVMNSETCRNGAIRCTRATGLNAGTDGTAADSVFAVLAVSAGAASVGAASWGDDSAESRLAVGDVGAVGNSTLSIGLVDVEMMEQAGKPMRQPSNAARA
jgi:hypothetical protein